jgi:hypothetical protein
MNPIQRIAALGLLAAAAASWPAHAHEGDAHDDHGDEQAAPAPAGTLPRFAAVSPAFELVGIVDGRQLTLYLDRFDDNSPVENAKIELALGSQTVAVEHHAGGEYEATLAQPLPSGELAVKASVTTGATTEQLAGELDLHEPAPAPAAQDAHRPRPLVGWVLAAAVAALAAWGLARRLAARSPRAGGAA